MSQLRAIIAVGSSINLKICNTLSNPIKSEETTYPVNLALVINNFMN